MLTLGIDDAGRGPIIGPMILAGVLLTKEQEKFLKAEGVADSKLLTHERRVALSKIIKNNSVSSKVVLSFPSEIDSVVLGNESNLNTLEAEKTAEIINALTPENEKIKVVVDCPSINTLSWKNKLISFISNMSNIELACEHKADVNHVAVSAASILAKVRREEEVKTLKKKYGDLGSGYPSDPQTKEFLKSHGQKFQNEGIFRKSWATWKSLFPEAKQQTLF